jgi:hypothetical protein
MFQSRRLEPLVAGSVLIIVTLLAGCSTPGASAGPTATTTATQSSSGSPATSMGPETAAPTPLLTMDISFLPEAPIDPATVELACEPPADATGMSCEDALALTARIAATMSAGAPTKVLVDRPAGDPNMLEVTFWTPAEEAEGELAFTSAVDLANQTVTFPVEDSEAVFPGTT